MSKINYYNGGDGSGNFGHKGRKGKVGGSSKYSSSSYSAEDLSNINRNKILRNIINKKSILVPVLKNKIQERLKNNSQLAEKLKQYKISRQNNNNKQFNKNIERINNIKTIQEATDYLKENNINLEPDGLKDIEKIKGICKAQMIISDCNINIKRIDFDKKASKTTNAFVYNDNRIDDNDKNVIFFNKLNNNEIFKKEYEYKNYKDIEEIKDIIGNNYIEKEYDNLKFYEKLKEQKINSFERDKNYYGIDFLNKNINNINKNIENIKKNIDKVKNKEYDSNDYKILSQMKNDTNNYNYGYNVSSAISNNSNEEYEASFIHESGHLLQQSIIKKTTKIKNEDIKKNVINTYKIIEKEYLDCNSYEPQKQIKSFKYGKYACSNEKEFFAECFLIYKKQPDKLDKNIKEAYDFLVKFNKENNDNV